MCKKVFVVLVLSFNMFWCSSQSVSDLYSAFSRADKVEKVNLNFFVMTLLRPMMLSAELNGIRVKSLQVMDLSECSRDVKKSFSNMVFDLEDEIYETLVQVNDGDETVKVLAKNDGVSIRELVVLTTGDDATYVRLRGKFTIEDAHKIAIKH